MESFADEAIFHFTVAAAYTAFMFVHTNFDGRHVYIPSTLDSIVRRKFSLPLLGQTEVLLLNNICKWISSDIKWIACIFHTLKMFFWLLKS